MTRFKVCGCHYTDSKGKPNTGIYIHNRKTNTFIVINKKLERVTDIQSLVTCESSIGNMFIDLK